MMVTLDMTSGLPGTHYVAKGNFKFLILCLYVLTAGMNVPGLCGAGQGSTPITASV